MYSLLILYCEFEQVLQNEKAKLLLKVEHVVEVAKNVKEAVERNGLVMRVVALPRL
jgi:hypothetical protein